MLACIYGDGEIMREYSIRHAHIFMDTTCRIVLFYTFLRYCFVFMKRYIFILLMLLSSVAFAQPTGSGFAVVELFTSQGCGSCPAAEIVLKKEMDDAVKNNKPVYFLSFHVDYWNKYGWKDPYSSIKYSRRQNNYVSATGSNEVFTPQVFINGNTGFVGSDSKRLKIEIEKGLKTPSKQKLTVKVMQTLNDTLHLSYSASKADANANIIVAVVQKSVTTKITKGENIGRTLVQDNVVRLYEVYPADLKGTILLKTNKLTLDENFQLIAFIQNKQSKKISAVTALTL